jgi:RNA polymerase sigma factor (sigma-70 family)
MDLHLISEKQLVKGCLKGKIDYQKELFARYASSMLGVSHRYSRNRDDAYDVLQESFIKIFNHLADFKFQGSLEGWIRKTVVNTALNYYRKSSFQSEKSGLDKYQNSVEVDSEALDNLNEQDIVNAISTLPDGYRMVFNLYAIEGYSHKEIANLLEIDESTSRSQLFKARNSLKTLLFETQKILL